MLHIDGDEIPWPIIINQGLSSYFSLGVHWIRIAMLRLLPFAAGLVLLLHSALGSKKMLKLRGNRDDA